MLGANLWQHRNRGGIHAGFGIGTGDHVQNRILVGINLDPLVLFATFGGPPGTGHLR